MRLLEAQGLHAVTVKSCWEVIDRRHLHPREAALLIGLPGDWEYQRPARFSLPLLGQIASPIQSCWMLALTMEAVEPTSSSPEEVLHGYLRHVVLSHMREWPDQRLHLARTLHVHEQDEDAEMITEVRTPIMAKEVLLRIVHSGFGCGLCCSGGTTS